MVVVVGVTGERNGIEACAGGGWEKRRTGADLCSLVRRGEFSDACAGEEKTREDGNAMRDALLMALFVVNSLGERGAV